MPRDLIRAIERIEERTFRKPFELGAGAGGVGGRIAPLR
jgi:hypothetical protein